MTGKKLNAKIAKIGAMDFEPWDTPSEETLVLLQQNLGAEEMMANGQAVMAALALLELSKPELIAKFRGLNAMNLLAQRKGEDPTGMRMIHDLELAQGFFEGCADVIKAALARLTVVVAATVSKGADGTERASC